MAEKGKFWSALVVAAFSLAVYLITTPHTIFLGDNAEFITAGATLGVPHPPGFPLYTLLAKVFSLLPFGSVVFRINLLSVASAVGALVFFDLLLMRLLKNSKLKRESQPWFAALSILILGFSPIFWEQAIMAETYALNVFFVALNLWLLQAFWETRNLKFLPVAGLALGLACANHPMFALFLPFFIVGVLLHAGSAASKYKFFGLLGLCLGLSVYLILPLLSSRGPYLDWGQTSESIKNFVDHLTRTQYGDLGFTVTFGDKMKYLVSAFYRFVGQFGLLLLLAPLGLYLCYRSSKKFLFVSLGVFLMNVFGIIGLRNVPFSFDGAYFFSAYYTPAYAMVSLWIVCGLATLVGLMSSRLRTDIAIWTLTVALPLLFAGSLFVINFDSKNLSDFSFIEDFSRGVFESLDEDAVLLVSSEGIQEDSFIFSLLYQRVVAGVRPDVEVVTYRNIFPGEEGETLDEIYRRGSIGEARRGLLEYALSKWSDDSRPIYTTFLFDGQVGGRRLVTNSNGYVYRVQLPTEETTSIQVAIDARDEKTLLSDYSGRDFLAYYYLVSAAGYAQAQDRDLSQSYYIKSIQTDNELQGEDLQNYKIHRDRVLFD